MTVPLPVPGSLPEFQRMFPDEDACRKYLFAVRWPSGFRCPKCASETAWWRKDGRSVECERKHVTSATAGTVMHKTHLPLLTWFYGAFLTSTLTPGISALQFARQLGLSRYETAYVMLHKLRSGLVDPDRTPLRGRVQVDEALLGGETPGRPGRSHGAKAIVAVAVEIVGYQDTTGRKPGGGHVDRQLREGPPEQHARGDKPARRRERAGRVRLEVIPDASAATLEDFVSRHVAPGATVSTDGWSGYGGLEGLGYAHKVVKQSRKGKSTGQYLPMVHLVISNLKRTLLGTHKGAILPHHLPAYLNEFAYRFNRRFWKAPSFLRALGLSAAPRRPRLEYKRLYAVRKGGDWQHPNPRPSGVPKQTV